MREKIKAEGHSKLSDTYLKDETGKVREVIAFDQYFINGIEEEKPDKNWEYVV